MAKKDKLWTWQERLKRAEAAYAPEIARMDAREAMYKGDRKLRQITDRDDRKTTATHVRNISAEIIEAQVDSNIPQPKVTARRKKDEDKAKLIEDMIRNELDRLPMETLNDMLSRTVPIQGGAAILLEWDNTQRTHTTVGELTVTALHPKMIVPQDGVTSGIEDMDYIILKLPQTRETIKRRYGVDLEDESEAEPEIRSSDNAAEAEDMVTQYVAYYRNSDGGIGLYSWVGETQLEDMEDYQARRVRRCATCGATEPQDGDPVQTTDPETAAAVESAREPDNRPRHGKKVCPYCGGTKWESTSQDYEELMVPVQRSDGSIIPHVQIKERPSMTTVDANGLPVVEQYQERTKIPYYSPRMYPILLLKNVSVYGHFLGDSDLDKIADQQNTTNRIESKIVDKLIKSGSYLTLPADATIRADAEDMKVIYPENPAAFSMISVKDLQGNISQDMAYLQQIYEEARQIIGITDSFQGRKDATATSGKAKEFAAAQSAGRLESKRVMKDSAYASLFEAIFKFRLAYTDEPRPVVSEDIHGNPVYQEFNRWDFLEQDAAGEWYWNDQFLFSCDTSAPLASNREAMWQETRLNLQSGAFGNPTDLRTLILFWTKMEMLHYPGAGETRKYLEAELQQQMQAMAAQQEQAQKLQDQIMAQARQDAARTAQQMILTFSIFVPP